ncbi:MAG: YcnI family protein [Acidimicrobiia bacterium]
MRVITRLSVAIGAGAVGLALTAAPAFAHVSTSPGEAMAGKSTYQQFKIGHGCEGSPTTKVTFFIPEGVVGVKPEVEPGWKIETKLGAITPYDSHGETIAEGVKEIAFTAATPLPDDQVTFFGVSMTMPDKAGETISIPVVQTCQQGETRWIDIPVEGQEEPEHPAPGIRLVAATAEDDDHGAAPAADEKTEGGQTATDGEDAAAVQAGRVEDGGDTLAIIALIVGAAGLLTGGYSLVALRKRA